MHKHSAFNEFWVYLLIDKKSLKVPKGYSEAGNRRTDNTMAKRYQRGNQKPGIEEGQTIQWPKEKGQNNK